MTATVIAVDEDEVTLDLKSYTEGIIRASDYSREPGFQLKEAVHVGDEVTATVIGRDSKREVSCCHGWKLLTIWPGRS